MPGGSRLSFPTEVVRRVGWGGQGSTRRRWAWRRALVGSAGLLLVMSACSSTPRATAIAVAASPSVSVGAVSTTPDPAPSTVPSPSESVDVGGVRPAPAPLPSADPRLLAAGQEGMAAQVPWSRVGPGWILAQWSPYVIPRPGTAGVTSYPDPESPSDRLYLIDPAGGRYLIDFHAEGHLEGWSGDGARALYSGGPTGTMIVDLATGESHSGPSVQPNDVVTFTEPKGTALIIARSDPSQVGTSGHWVARYSLSGALQQAFPGSSRGAGFGATALDTPDGTQVLVANPPTGFELVSNNGGAVIRTLADPPGTRLCSPTRWFAPGVALLNCLPPGSGTPVLWLLRMDGSPATQLTTPSPSLGDSGDVNAFTTPSGTFVQSLGACGYSYVSTLHAGSTHPVKVDVPGLATGDSQVLLGTYQGTLAVMGQTACGTGGTLVWFNPVTDSSVSVLGGAVNGGDVVVAYAFGAELP